MKKRMKSKTFLANKKGQDSFNLSFGMIFSIILIIVFLVAAVFAIKMIMNRSCQANVNLAFSDFNYYINDVNNELEAQKYYNLAVPNQIKYICFVGQGVNENIPRVYGDVYDSDGEQRNKDLKFYMSRDKTRVYKQNNAATDFNYNIYFWPFDKTCDAPSMAFLHCGEKTPVNCVRFGVDDNKNGNLEAQEMLSNDEISKDNWIYCIKNKDSNKIKLIKNFGDSKVYVNIKKSTS